MTTKVNGDTGVSQCQPNSVSQDDLQANVVGKGPIFSVSRTGNQNLPDITDTPIIFNSVQVDSVNGFNIANGRYTAKVAGWYQIQSVLSISGLPNSNTAGVVATIRKNGATASAGINSRPAINLFANPGVVGLIYLNGTTDYVEIAAYPDSNGVVVTLQGTNPWRNLFSGFLVKAD